MWCCMLMSASRTLGNVVTFMYAHDARSFAAKKRLLAAFDTLDDAELVGRCRRRMASLLF